MEGTKVQMEDGSFKEIQLIRVGEKVKTKDGVNEVVNTWNPETLEEGTPECYEIEFEDGSKVVCSDKHKFLVNNKWVEAQNLTNDMNVETIY